MKYYPSSWHGCRNPASRDGKPWAEASLVVNLKLHVLVSGCIRDIHVPNPSGGKAVQFGYPCRFVRHPYRNDGFFSTLVP
jgi:hypothetical protein